MQKETWDSQSRFFLGCHLNIGFILTLTRKFSFIQFNADFTVNQIFNQIQNFIMHLVKAHWLSYCRRKSVNSKFVSNAIWTCIFESSQVYTMQKKKIAMSHRAGEGCINFSQFRKKYRKRRNSVAERMNKVAAAS